MPRHSRLGPVLPTFLVLVLTACGSTVASEAGSLDAGLAPGAGTGVDPGAATDPLAAPALGGQPGSKGSVPGATGSSGAAGQQGAAPDSGSAGGGSQVSSGDGAVGPGVTNKKIYIGIPYAPDTGSANAALGASGTDPGDARDYYNAIIDELNAHGGVKGREVVPLYFEYRVTSSEPIESQAQAACEYWTSDNKVFAILDRFDVSHECGMDAGALVPVAGSRTGPYYDRFPVVVDPVGVAVERLNASTVVGAQRQGYFKTDTRWPSGKVGVLTWDDESYRFGHSRGTDPALRGIGVEPTDTRYIPVPNTVGAISESSAAVSNAVLRFQSQGIDHVVIADGSAGVFAGGGLAFMFMNNAQSQNYYPRYAVNSGSAPGASYLPARQQRGLVSVEYGDATPADDAGIRANPERERCFAIMKKHGVGVGDDSKMLAAAGACSQVWFTTDLLDRASAPTLPSVLAAADRLGSSFRSPSTYGTFIGPGQHDGVSKFRLSRFDDSCSCMRFNSSPYTPGQ